MKLILATLIKPVLYFYIKFFSLRKIIYLALLIMFSHMIVYLFIFIKNYCIENKYRVFLLTIWSMDKIILIKWSILSLDNFYHVLFMLIIFLYLYGKGSYLDKKFELLRFILICVQSLLACIICFFLIQPYLIANMELIKSQSIIIFQLTGVDRWLLFEAGLVISYIMPDRTYYINAISPYLITHTRLLIYNPNPQRVGYNWATYFPQWLWYNVRPINNRIFNVMHEMYTTQFAGIPFRYVFPIFGLGLEADIVAARIMAFILENLRWGYNMNQAWRDEANISIRHLPEECSIWYKNFLDSNKNNNNNDPAFRALCEHYRRVSWIGYFKADTTSITMLKNWVPL